MPSRPAVTLLFSAKRSVPHYFSQYIVTLAPSSLTSLSGILYVVSERSFCPLVCVPNLNLIYKTLSPICEIMLSPCIVRGGKEDIKLSSTTMSTYLWSTGLSLSCGHDSWTHSIILAHQW